MNEPIPIGRFTDQAFQTLRELAGIHPELWQNPRTDFTRELHQLNLSDPVEIRGTDRPG